MDLLERLNSEFGSAVESLPATAADAVDEVAPHAVAAPRDEESARALLGWCGREKVAFVARGGGSSLHIGARPTSCELIVSTQYLTEVRDHDEGNATVSVGAGIPLAALNTHVQQQGQFVPLDGAHDGSPGTLGGAIATNRVGPSKLKYGAPRDLVVGLHAALSDGRLIKAGSKVVKNVSGYDLNKIFIGSHGSLGLVTDVTLRLRPNDVAGREWRHEPNSWNEAAKVAAELLGGAYEPTSVQFRYEADDFFLIARFDGGEAAVMSQVNRLPASVAPPVKISVPAAVLQLCAVLPLQNALDWAKRAHESGSSQVIWECGLGIVRAAFDKQPENVAGLVEQLRAAAIAAEGVMKVEIAPAAAKTPDFVWGAPPGSWKLMQRLKQSYDAAGVCSPGRFVGGL